MRTGKVLATLSLIAATAVTGVTATMTMADPPASQAQALPLACALPLQSADTLSQHNVSNPDVESNYWIIAFQVQPGLRITLNGRYPDSRYFSIETYDSTGLPFTANSVGSTLTDYRIAPDPGSVNPWQQRARPGGRFTVNVQSDVTPGQVNTLPLAPTGTAAGTGGRIYFRVYVAHGGPSRIILPTATFTVGGTAKPVRLCPAGLVDGGSPGQLTPAEIARVNSLLSANGGIVPFSRLPDMPDGTPDSDAGYLTGFVSPPQGDDVVVIRAKAPAAPKGSRPSPWPEPSRDVQYWSLCNDVFMTPVPVVLNTLPNGKTDFGCRFDSQVQLDQNDYYTFVLGTEAQRAAIDRIPGATFVPFSAANPTQPHVLFLRNLVANTAFAEAIQNVPENESASAAEAIMGPYYPKAVICSLRALARGIQRAINAGVCAS